MTVAEDVYEPSSNGGPAPIYAGLRLLCDRVAATLLVGRLVLVAARETAIDLLVIAEPVMVSETSGDDVEMKLSVLSVDGLATSLIEVEESGLALIVLIVEDDIKILAVYVFAISLLDI